MKRWHQTNFFEIPLPLVPRRPHCLNEKAARRIDRRRFFVQNQASQGFPKIIDKVRLVLPDMLGELCKKAYGGAPYQMTKTYIVSFAVCAASVSKNKT
ncbi:hypothetical protein ACWGPW_04605 [Paenibacillus chitinolyticus]